VDTTTETGGLVLPPLVQNFSYDADGSLTNDAVWTYTWDAENRLIEMVMTNVTGIPNAQRYRLQFAYDTQQRRVLKVVSTWNGTSFGSPQTNRFVYDGWNLMAEIDSANNLLRSYSWGLDVTAALENAGGVGALVMMQEHTNSTALHFPTYDGNGNLTGLVKTNGTVTARYEFGPFGETLRATGQAAGVNPFRWSTKFHDDQSGLINYGYRMYNPAVGRWLQRDPITERGGLNLYAFVQNRPIDLIGPDGRYLIDVLIAVTGEVGGKVVELATKATYVQRVRAAVKNMDNLQMFIAGIHEAEDNAYVDMLQTINELQDLAGQGLRGDKAIANREHHLTPAAKEFSQFFGKAGVDANKATVDTTKWNHDALHGNYKGVSDGKGGPYNEIWRRAKEKSTQNPKDKRWKNKYFIAGFAAGIAKELGLDTDTTHRARRPR
jgi:RHS repeat-associated protein